MNFEFFCIIQVLWDDLFNVYQGVLVEDFMVVFYLDIDLGEIICFMFMDELEVQIKIDVGCIFVLFVKDGVVGFEQWLCFVDIFCDLVLVERFFEVLVLNMFFYVFD